MIPESVEKSHGKKEGPATWDVSEAILQRDWHRCAGRNGYVCSKCGCRHGYRLPNGRYQCAQCRHQASVTAGTVLHKTHMPLTQWFLAFYFVSQDKRGISAVQLAAMLGTAHKTAGPMLRRIRSAMGQRDETRQLCGVIEFDDAYFDGQTAGKKRGRAQKGGGFRGVVFG